MSTAPGRWPIRVMRRRLIGRPDEIRSRPSHTYSQSSPVTSGFARSPQAASFRAAHSSQSQARPPSGRCAIPCQCSLPSPGQTRETPGRSCTGRTDPRSSVAHEIGVHPRVGPPPPHRPGAAVADCHVQRYVGGRPRDDVVSWVRSAQVADHGCARPTGRGGSLCADGRYRSN